LLQGIDDRRSRHTIALSVRLKRTLHAGARRELQHDPLVKLKEITLPGPVERQPIGPADRRVIAEALAVVELKARDGGRIANRLLSTEHQQTGKRQPFPSAGSIPSPSTELLQQATVVLGLPDMLDTC